MPDQQPACDRATEIVFVGSSILEQWASLPGFFPGPAVLNTAVGGSQTRDILARLDELVVRHAPRLVCYYCGSNDINAGVPATTIVANVLETDERLRRRLPGLRFIYLSIVMAPQKAPLRRAVDEVNEKLCAAAQARPGFQFVDINPVFLRADGQPRSDFYQADGLHLTPAAYLALGEYLAPRIKGEG